jgi:hypothetical protein
MHRVVACLFALAFANAPRVGTGTGRVHDLAALTPRDAYALQGRPALFLVKVDSGEDEHGGFTLYDCVSPDDVLRSAWLYNGREVDDEMVVEATLRVIHHPGKGEFVGFTEYRLERAFRWLHQQK